MFCQDVDDETFHLIIRLQLEDLESIKRADKGKHKEDDLLDSDFAVEAYKLELKAGEQLASDRCMCKSIAKANRQDGHIISSLVAQEKQAARDREAALRLSRGGLIHPGVATATPNGADMGGEPELDTDLIKRLNRLYVSANADEDDNDQPESSSWAASRNVNNGTAHLHQEKKTCNSCMEKYPSIQIAGCPCHHEYCGDCLRSLFEASLTDESLFPPRCCGQPIPVEDNRIFLTPKLVGEFRAKTIEFSTTNRTYCHQPTCSTFIPKGLIQGDIASCPRCLHKTCTICKGPEHQGEDCGNDTATQSLLQLAAENGWQRCFSCRRVVELDHGCNHMTCPCHAEFCYVCGLKWKTCTCPQWNEERLYARANAIANRNAGFQQFDAGRQARVVEREAQNLMQNHECTHMSWRSRSGSFTCEECHDTLPTFIYECRQCRIRACRRCRFNRL
ncbi:IBR finger domain-containing protein [Colletotrichum truncatum]|uniref:IBR finger domain-containing protein n=1 Tax=Colletotrichum truncatum TaxID=5467 RepID=A0ACC3ZK82_COLTU|nr:IBR finger domain-containing protein [Colletotrichum truncatum]KAF6799916.1 IBR finger domain-containing protein [Colletotrichum truncatum]